MRAGVRDSMRLNGMTIFTMYLPPPSPQRGMATMPNIWRMSRSSCARHRRRVCVSGETMRCRNSERGETERNICCRPHSLHFCKTMIQIGNRAFGERLIALTDDAALRAASAVYLLAAQIPMLFMR